MREILSSLLFHPERVSLDALAALDPSELAAAAEQEQVVTAALGSLQRITAGPGGSAVRAHVEHAAQSARRWTLYEALQRRAVRDVLDRMPAGQLLFFKGASLAYSLYAAPSDRMRLDWDLLVEPEGLAAAQRALGDAGFEPDLKAPDGIRVRQRSYRRRIGDGECTIDLHTSVFNAPSLAAPITFAGLHTRSAPLPSLHPAARGVSDIDALLVACLHRPVHHAGEARLVWDCDIRLLVSRVEPSIDRVVARALEWRAGPLVAREILRVTRDTGDELSAAIARAVGALAAQPSEALGFAREDRSRSDDFLLDWRALGWRDRAALARQTFFPDAAFVRASSGSTLPLPLLYVRRLVRGAAAWLRRPRPPRGPDLSA